MTSTDDTPRLTLRMHEVAKQTGASLTSVKGWVASGDLPSIRPNGPGGTVLIRPADLEAFLDARREGNHIAPPARLQAVRRRKPA